MIKAIFEFNDGSLTLHSEKTDQVHTKFPSGLFTCYQDNNGIMHVKREKFNEVHTPFPHQNSKVILDSIAKFLDPEMHKVCNEMGYVYKMNLLLHGKQGTGKTALANYIASQLIEVHGGIVIMCSGIYNVNAVISLAKSIREIQNTPIAILMDEFEVYCKGEKEASMKGILDGPNSIDYSMIFGSTNYLDRVPPTIKDRPSRFHIVAEIPPIQNKEIVNHLVESIISKTDHPFIDEQGKVELVEEIMTEEETVTVDVIKSRVLHKLMKLQVDLIGTGRIGFNTRGSDLQRSSVTSIGDQLDALKTKYDSTEEEVEGEDELVSYWDAIGWEPPAPTDHTRI